MTAGEVDAARVAERLEVVRAAVAETGVDPAEVTIVAVTKGFGAAAVAAATAAGLHDLGENYAPELLAKAATAATAEVDLRWHFIGRLQRNKVAKLASSVALWQSIDRPELGAEVARRAPGARVLVQVNAAGEPTKGGCAPGDTARLVAELQALGLAVEGLMVVAPAGSAPAARRAFELVRAQADALGLAICSMGMSGDYPAAVAAGSTMLRLGSALFGPRPGAAGVRN